MKLRGLRGLVVEDPRGDEDSVGPASRWGADAGRAAASVAIGLADRSATLLYGLHFWIVVAICVPLKLDAALAYLAANISLPFDRSVLALGGGRARVARSNT